MFKKTVIKSTLNVRDGRDKTRTYSPKAHNQQSKKASAFYDAKVIGITTQGNIRMCGFFII